MATHRRTPPPPAAGWGSKRARLTARGIMFHLACCQMKLTRNRAGWRGMIQAPHPKGGGAILYVATWCQPVGYPHVPTNPHNPACRGGSGHQRLLISERLCSVSPRCGFDFHETLWLRESALCNAEKNPLGYMCLLYCKSQHGLDNPCTSGYLERSNEGYPKEELCKGTLG